MSAAKVMITRLKTSARAQMVKEMEGLCNAYIELANMPVDPKFKTETSRCC